MQFNFMQEVPGRLIFRAWDVQINPIQRFKCLAFVLDTLAVGWSPWSRINPSCWKTAMQLELVPNRLGSLFALALLARAACYESFSTSGK